MQADISRLREALVGLERRFKDQRAPVGRHLRPGLKNEQIDLLTSALPFPLSDELRCLYQWHDGVLELARPEWPDFPGGRILRPLHEAVQDFFGWDADEKPSPGTTFQSHWFPINSQGVRCIAVDCAVAPGQASPIHYVDVHASLEWDVPVAASLLEVIDLWNHMLDAGYWVYDTEAAEWEDQYAQIPLEIRHTNLV